MKFGKLDRRIRFRKYTAARDDYGQKTVVLENLSDTDSTLGNVWAEWIPKGSPKESPHALQLFPMRDGVFNIRHPRGSFELDEEQVIEYDGESYNVLGFQEIGRRDGFRVFVTRRKDG